MSRNAHAGLLAALALLCLPARLAAAQDGTAGALTIERPWIRATPGGASVAGGYVTIVNHGTVPDRLVGGSLALASGFALHTMAMTGDVMTMRPTGPLAIPVGGTLSLAPSGTHIMFTGLAHGLSKGQTVEGTLVFEHAGTVPVGFTVEGIGAKAPSMPGMDMN